MFPLGMVVFPHQQLGLYVFEARYQQMLCELGPERRFGTCLIARGSEVGGNDERLSIGTVVEILAAQPFADGRTLILIEGVHCCEVTLWLDDAPYPRAVVRERCGVAQDHRVDGEGTSGPAERGERGRVHPVQLRHGP
jgi:Lon protease-like protein